MTLWTTTSSLKFQKWIFQADAFFAEVNFHFRLIDLSSYVKSVVNHLGYTDSFFFFFNIEPWRCFTFIKLFTWIDNQHTKETSSLGNRKPPWLGDYPTLRRLHGKLLSRLTGLPYSADRATHLDGSPHLSCIRDEDKRRDYMNRWVTSPTWASTSM